MAMLDDLSGLGGDWHGVLMQSLRSFGLLVGVPVAFWSADSLVLSAAGREALWKGITAQARDTAAALLVFDRYFEPGRGTARYLGNVLVFSVTSIFILMIGFSYLVPAFTTLFLTDTTARYFFIRQIVTEGLFTVFVVNYVALQVFAAVRRTDTGVDRMLLPIFALDVFLRICLFAICVAFVYVASAQVFDSFGGSAAAALRAVGETLRGAVRFENITGVYLYAAAISGLPLFVATVADLMQRSATFGRVIRSFFFFLPFYQRPILSIAFVVGVFFAAFSALSQVIFQPL